MPSFRRVGAKRFLCLRPPGKVTKEDRKNHVQVSFINAAGKPYKGWLNTVKVFIAQDRRSGSTQGTSKRYYIIARNLDEAKAKAGSRRIKRIERYAGMAKWLIGKAQAKVSDSGALDAQTPSAVAQRVGNSALTVVTNEVGYGKGSVSVSVDDALKYAQLALKNGPSDFDLALQKAANRTAGIINAHLAKFAFLHGDPVTTPFPEVKGRR